MQDYVADVRKLPVKRTGDLLHIALATGDMFFLVLTTYLDLQP